MEDEHKTLLDLEVSCGTKQALFGQDPAYADQPEHHAYFAVYDGHNGREAVEFVAERLHADLAKSTHFPHNLVDAVRDAFFSTEVDLLKKSEEKKWESGTTALVLLIRGDHLLVANAGDCRAVLSRGGKAIALSEDHSPKLPSEISRIKRAGGWVGECGVGDLLSVSRSFGDWDPDDYQGLGRQCKIVGVSAEPQISEQLLRDEDEFIIIACDGLWDVISNEVCRWIDVNEGQDGTDQ
jgi:protein phosphatase 2C family protein 2/3